MSSQYSFEQPQINRYPAVLLGGPPHSGKSVLLASLSKALRDRGVDHYALRACPDGEGNWANLADPRLVRNIRMDTKGEWTTVWVERMVRDINCRRLPFLVDMGGKPTLEQERMFEACTYAILLTPNANAENEWQQRMERNNVTIIASLTSQLHGENQLFSVTPVVQGVITGLERNSLAQGVVFDELLERLIVLFTNISETAKEEHLRQPPCELTFDIDRLANTLGFVTKGESIKWKPEHVPLVMTQLPAQVPLAAYGVWPGWLHVALALFAYPAAYYSYDVRLGWMQATMLQQGNLSPTASLQFKITETEDSIYMNGLLPFNYIDYLELAELHVPHVANDKGIILGGPLPNWLFTSLAITYRNAPWIATYQPQLDKAVIGYSKSASYSVGSCISVG